MSAKRLLYLFVFSMVTVEVAAILFLFSQVVSLRGDELRSSFLSQNVQSLARGDGLALAQSLERLSMTTGVRCLRGEVGGREFFSSEGGGCDSVFLGRLVDFKSSSANGVSFSFLLVPTLKQWLWVVSIIAGQILVLLVISIFTRRQEQQMNSKISAYAEAATKFAHNLHAPLAAIKQIDGIGLESDIDILLKEAVSRIESESRELLSKMKSLSVSQFLRQTSRVAAERSFTYSELKNELIQQIEFLSVEARLHVKFEFSDSEVSNSRWIGEVQDVGQVVGNLLKNAREAYHHEESHPRVVVEVRREGSFLSVSVCDWGIGFPKHILGTVGRSLVSFGKKTGTGFGLYDAAARMESWGGGLKVESPFRGEPTYSTRISLYFIAKS